MKAVKDAIDIRALCGVSVAALFAVGLAACGGEREEPAPVDPFAEEVEEMTDDAYDAWEDAVDEAEEAWDEGREAAEDSWDNVVEEFEDDDQ